MAPGPTAQRGRQNNFCCVTTRRRNLRGFRHLQRRWRTPTARTFRLGMLAFGRLFLTPSCLPSRRLPAPHPTQTFGILAVTLVPTPRLVGPFTTFAQATPRPRSSRPGLTAALWIIMTVAHGSVIPKGQSGENASTFSPDA